MRIRYTVRARDDLRTILTYVESRSRQGATNVARAMRKSFELIGQFPQSGRLAGEQGTRVLPVGRYPYLIYWTVEQGEVGLFTFGTPRAGHGIPIRTALIES
jgi:toxin ParE1/3/4